jgi:hypothetical protein
MGEFQWRHAQLLCGGTGMGLYFRVFDDQQLASGHLDLPGA